MGQQYGGRLGLGSPWFLLLAWISLGILHETTLYSSSRFVTNSVFAYRTSWALLSVSRFRRIIIG